MATGCSPKPSAKQALRNMYILSCVIHVAQGKHVIVAPCKQLLCEILPKAGE